MRILIKRFRLSGDPALRTVTLGRMFIDGLFECFTEEPPMRAERLFIAGECLPLGLYSVSLSKSPIYSRNVPLLASPLLTSRSGKPEFQIAMHIQAGHYTLENPNIGIIVGKTLSKDNVHHTRTAFDALVPKLEAVVRAGEEAIELGIVMDDE